MLPRLLTFELLILPKIDTCAALLVQVVQRAIIEHHVARFVCTSKSSSLLILQRAIILNFMQSLMSNGIHLFLLIKLMMLLKLIVGVLLHLSFASTIEVRIALRVVPISLFIG